MQVNNAVFPPMEQAMAFFGSGDDGAFVMVNLLKFKPKAEYEDGSDAHLTGAEAYARYGAAVQACLAAVGGRLHLRDEVRIVGVEGARRPCGRRLRRRWRWRRR